MTYAAYLLVDLFPVSLLLAAFSDLRTMTIPNRLCLFIAIAFFPTALMANLSLNDWIGCLSMGALGFVLGMVMFALRFMGGGDAKLIAAASLWVGFGGYISFIAYTAIAGGALTLALLSLRKLNAYYAPPLPDWAARLMLPKGDIPYGVAICAGGLLAIPHSPLRHLFGFN
jgi:prepilin peptidase CpaA